ncbi:hypothetical protein JL100_027995 [Skermanella mucosa]|uniref:hypothetical protein n=1 Tax=Skermanella mucosa TaxID=1789672 RepID=UPI001E3B1DCE|nr:hypothetical protein [Skermanella mucosa]UEM20866.1 hypothetical protein JL100_027995 [Skermanella mucosa]
MIDRHRAFQVWEVFALVPKRHGQEPGADQRDDLCGEQVAICEIAQRGERIDPHAQTRVASRQQRERDNPA